MGEGGGILPPAPEENSSVGLDGPGEGEGESEGHILYPRSWAWLRTGAETGDRFRIHAGALWVQ